MAWLLVRRLICRTSLGCALEISNKEMGVGKVKKVRKVKKLLLMFILLSPAAQANDVWYGINDSGITVGQRFYCQYGIDWMPCGVVNNGGVVTTVPNGSWYDVGIFDINNSGQMVGQVVAPYGYPQAASCTLNGCGSLQYILKNNRQSTAWKINDAGYILASRSNYSTVSRKTTTTDVLIYGGSYTTLPKVEPSGGYSVTKYFALNNNLDTGGVYYNPTQSIPALGFIRTAAGVVTLIQYPDAKTTEVRGLSDDGTAVGVACMALSRDFNIAGATCSDWVGFTYKDGEFTAVSGMPFDVNNYGGMAQ